MTGHPASAMVVEAQECREVQDDERREDEVTMVAAEDVAVEAAPVAPEATGERNGKETVAQVAVPRKRALPAQDRHAKSTRSASGLVEVSARAPRGYPPSSQDGALSR